jgi:hypothetical protein
MPTAFYWQESNEESDNIALVTFLCEATRPANLIVANHSGSSSDESMRRPG